MKKWIMGLCTGVAAALAALASGSSAEAACSTISYEGSGVGWGCSSDGRTYTWRPCQDKIITFNLSAWNQAFLACQQEACSYPHEERDAQMVQCMLGCACFSCGNCPC